MPELKKHGRDPDYQILSATSSEKLRIAVVEAMRDGWRPAGGVAVLYTPSEAYIYQAMAKDR